MLASWMGPDLFIASTSSTVDHRRRPIDVPSTSPSTDPSTSRSPFGGSLHSARSNRGTALTEAPLQVRRVVLRATRSVSHRGTLYCRSGRFLKRISPCRWDVDGSVDGSVDGDVDDRHRQMRCRYEEVWPQHPDIHLIDKT